MMRTVGGGLAKLYSLLGGPTFRSSMESFFKGKYTAKSYVLNQNWNQSDPDLYPETQQNFLATGLIPNCKSDLYQFCSSVSVQQKQP